MATRLRVLIVEDSEADCLLLLGELRRGGFAPEHERVETEEQMRRALRDRAWDVIVSDYSLPQFSGPAALSVLKGSGLDVPFMIVSGVFGEEAAIEAMHAGAQDYLTKDRLSRLPAAISRELAEAETRRQRKRAEDARVETEQRMEAIIDFLPDATFAIDNSGVVITWNRAIEDMTGVPAGEMLGRGDYGYALPFYATRRPMLIDLVRRSDPEIEREYHPILKREHGLLIAETWIPHLKGSRAFVWVKASLLYDSRGKPVGAIESMRDITDRRRAEEALLASEERHKLLLEASFEGLVILDNEVLVDTSPQFFRLLGYEPEEMAGRSALEFVLPEEADLVSRKLASRDEGPYETRLVRKDGSPVDVEMRSRHFSFHGREVRVTAVRDITERKRAEEAMARLQDQFLQAQKMEAVGRLAGGVAHDFNNLLMTILGNIELVKADGKAEGTVRECADEIEKAGRRAAALTNQLLAFSRKQMLQPKVLDLNALVENLSRMLRRVIGEDVTLRMDLEPALGAIRADPGQIEQVIVNLAVNARDAMPEGGTLTIATENTSLEARGDPEQPEPAPGDYVRLSVIDTGMGMDETVMSHLFEPFFTTKERGKGTGLGLPTVYGIIKQSDGYVTVRSEPGKGTAFRIDFPSVGSEPADSPVERAPEGGETAGGTETLLLVEDEEAPLSLMTKVLRGLGYTVIGSRSPADALQLTDKDSGLRPNLLVSDVVLPGMQGTELAKHMRRRLPSLKVLFVSGYMEGQVFRDGVLAEAASFLQKPFSLTDLARKVREVLDGG